MHSILSNPPSRIGALFPIPSNKYSLTAALEFSHLHPVLSSAQEHVTRALPGLSILKPFSQEAKHVTPCSKLSFSQDQLKFGDNFVSSQAVLVCCGSSKEISRA